MRLKVALGFAAAAAGALASSASAATPSEQQLATAIEQIQAGKPRDALKNLEQLTKQEPDFRLGKLIYGELLAALNEKPSNARSAADSPQMQALVEEAQVRLASEKAVPPEGTLPDSILKLAPAYKHLILVDLPRSRLYLMNNKDGELYLLRHHYIGIGKNGYGKQVEGDQRTPVGVYHITGWKTDGELPELYGSGALPLSYPNPWDVFKRRTGTGIWLHGVPRNVQSRPPRSSEGCVTMANDDLVALKPFMDLGHTPVVLSDELRWVPQDQLRSEREQWLTRIESWRQRWAAMDTNGYLSTYSQDFSTEAMGYAAFAAHKQRVNASKKFIKVELRDINLFRYPAAGESMVLAEFLLDYQSDNFSTSSHKQQFWRQEKDGSWKIFREENR